MYSVIYIPSRKQIFFRTVWNGDPGGHGLCQPPSITGPSKLIPLRAGVLAPDMEKKNRGNKEQRHHQNWNWSPVKMDTKASVKEGTR